MEYKVGDKVRFKKYIKNAVSGDMHDPDSFNNLYYGKTLTIINIKFGNRSIEHITESNTASIKLDVDVDNNFRFKPSRFEKVGICLPKHLFEV